MPKVTTVKVRALVDIEGVAKAGQAGEIPSDQLAGMKAAGVVDDNPEAVAYAESITPAAPAE